MALDAPRGCGRQPQDPTASQRVLTTRRSTLCPRSPGVALRIGATQGVDLQILWSDGEERAREDSNPRPSDP